MSRTKSKSPPETKHDENAADANGAATQPAGNVLTLAEAAAFLRVSEEDILRLVTTQALPGRQIGDKWRFYKPALKKWLSTSVEKKGILPHIGAIKDDPFAEEMLAGIYQRRKRSAAQKD